MKYRTRQCSPEVIEADVYVEEPKSRTMQELLMRMNQEAISASMLSSQHRTSKTQAYANINNAKTAPQFMTQEAQDLMVMQFGENVEKAQGVVAEAKAEEQARAKQIEFDNLKAEAMAQAKAELSNEK